MLCKQNVIEEQNVFTYTILQNQIYLQIEEKKLLQIVFSKREVVIVCDSSPAAETWVSPDRAKQLAVKLESNIK